MRAKDWKWTLILCVVLSMAAVATYVFDQFYALPGPTIPDPGPLHPESVPERPPSVIAHVFPSPARFTVQSSDQHRMLRTLKRDILDHGGWIDGGSAHDRKFVAVVPGSYLERIQPLMEAEARKPNYRAWVQTATLRPGPTAPLDWSKVDSAALIEFAVEKPSFSNKFTMTLT